MKLIEHLERILREEPVARKILVCPNRGVGRELLRALAVRGVGWIGFEITTPRAFALSISGDDLAALGRAPMDEFEEEALLDEAIDEAVEGDPDWTERLSRGIGFREAMANAVQALRLADVRPPDLEAAALENERKQDLLRRSLEAYERRLAGRGKADGASVFRAAVGRLAVWQVQERVFLAPGLRRGGLSGRFLEALLASGAEALESDPVLGLDPPPSGFPSPGGPPSPRTPPAAGNGGRRTGLASEGGDQTDLFASDPESIDRAGSGHGGLRRAASSPLSRLFGLDLPSVREPADGATAVDLYAAASPYEEIREALRRALTQAETWDQVEIVATDPVVYGSVLDEIATKLGIPVTYAVGLPVERSRPGRAVMAYLEWISADFPESLFRYLLASGDVAPPAGHGPELSGGRLARRLRRLRVGWGRDRYQEAIALRLRRLEAEGKEEPEPDPEDADRIRERDDRAREVVDLAALGKVLGPILEATPPVPDRIGLGGAPVSPAELARGLVTFLGFVPTRSAVEHEARERLFERLGRIGATLVRRTSFSSALAILRKHLDIRIPSPGAEGPPPWSSTGGHLHFSDLDHGGRTGRPVTFVVGLDAERFPGAGIQDPILLDDDRRRLEPSALPGTGEILEERRYALAAMLAGLRGRVTFSFSAWEAAAGRDMPPAGVVLQAYRLACARPLASYSDMRDGLGAIVSPVPGHGRAIDAGDVWLDALREDGLFRRAEELIRASFAGLDRGIAARHAHRGDVFSAHLGRIDPRPDVLDPRRNQELALSATALENLGSCPLAYLHQGVLGLRDPDDPRLDPGAWLEPRERGSLLHAVYEESLRRARQREVALDGSGFGELALEVLDEEISRFRGRVPIPSLEVFEREAKGLAEDMQVFIHMVHENPPDWVDLERGFGVYGAIDPPIEMPVDGGSIRTRGYIDRIDRLSNGNLRVVDYKTGRPRDHRAKNGVFHKGRRLQHAVYANAASALHGRPVEVVEYHFPTLRGDERPRAYPAARFGDGGRVIGRLLDLVAAGHFVPTDDASDCWYCDHRPICRVRDDYGETHSPPAEWAADVKASLPEFDPLEEVRRVEG
ncbi:MAG TPA: PD-(D/E)XK nuclease family protein [Gemmatimonadota bacterium]|nr:PD-(D/E)XK nuclease family protein [Gemmatimonadota bacterium]